MDIQLNVKPGFSCTWPQFLKHPPYSIALDGYVSGPPNFDQSGPRINFDHHFGVDRFATRSTCAQVLLALRMGLLNKFRNANIYVNDCDEDVCLSVALLKRPDFVTCTTNPIINRLVAIEDLLDSTSGMYPFNKNSQFLEELAWIFEPYHEFRRNGLITLNNSVHYSLVIESMCSRIYDYLIGRAKKKDLDFSYNVLNKYKDCYVVEEIGSQARLGMFSDGIKLFISVGKNGKYVIGKSSIFIDPDFEKLIKILNKIERKHVLQAGPWGGSNTIIGSPRNGGSKLSYEELGKIVSGPMTIATYQPQEETP